jgi:hypothetical protein
MNLRDYFAGQALAGIMSLEEAYENVSESSIASQAFSQADRMIEFAAAEPQLPTRGQLAMAAMQGMLAANCRGTAHVMARDAVAYADALLAELKKEQQCPRLAALKEARRVLNERHLADGSLDWVSPGETLLEFLGNVIQEAST